MPKQSDKFFAGGAGAIQQPVITEWEDFTPSFTGFSSHGVAHAQKRRVGSSMEVSMRLTSATTNAVLTFAIPEGLTGKTHIEERYGTLFVDGAIDAQPAGMPAFAYYRKADNDVAFYLGGTQVGAAGRALVSDIVTIVLSIPIAEWTETEAVTTMTDAELTARVQRATDTTSGSIPYYNETSWTYPNASGDWSSGSSGTVNIVRVGRVVTMTTTALVHNSSGGPTDGISMPSWAFPNDDLNFCVRTDAGSFTCIVQIFADGSWRPLYYSGPGTGTSRTGIDKGFSISWIVD